MATTPLINTDINTPNGPGTVQGPFYDNGHHYVLVRHILSKMTTTDKKIGICLTPKASYSGLWAYELHELEGYI